jgi:hypothetical protein
MLEIIHTTLDSIEGIELLWSRRKASTQPKSFNEE